MVLIKNNSDCEFQIYSEVHGTIAESPEEEDRLVSGYVKGPHWELDAVELLQWRISTNRHQEQLDFFERFFLSFKVCISKLAAKKLSWKPLEINGKSRKWWMLSELSCYTINEHRPVMANHCGSSVRCVIFKLKMQLEAEREPSW